MGLAISTPDGRLHLGRLLGGAPDGRFHQSARPASSSIRLPRAESLLLGYFKYFNFFVDSFAGVAALVGLHGVPHALWKVILPPAISFYTFQEVAYIVDVYSANSGPPVHCSNTLCSSASFLI